MANDETLPTRRESIKIAFDESDMFWFWFMTAGPAGFPHHELGEQ